MSNLWKILEAIKLKNSAGTIIDPATEDKQDAEAVLIGAVNETAPTTDTASSGVNGRLQRIAQNITNNLSLFEATSFGMRDGCIGINRTGNNPDVDTAAAEDIWAYGGTWTPMTAAQTVSLVSSSASDAAAGTGMRAVLITGLDANYAIATETIALNGLTPVVTVGTWTAIHTIQGISFGSGATNAGNITVTATTDTTVQAYITAGYGITRLSFYTIPAGYTAYIKRVAGDGANNTAGTIITFDLMINVFGTNGWVVPVSFQARADGSAAFARELENMYAIPEKSIIKIRASSSSNNSTVNVLYQLLLKAN